MAKLVERWQSDDGSCWPTEAAATKHDEKVRKAGLLREVFPAALFRHPEDCNYVVELVICKWHRIKQIMEPDTQR